MISVVRRCPCRPLHPEQCTRMLSRVYRPPCSPGMMRSTYMVSNVTYVRHSQHGALSPSPNVLSSQCFRARRAVALPRSLVLRRPLLGMVVERDHACDVIEYPVVPGESEMQTQVRLSVTGGVWCHIPFCVVAQCPPGVEQPVFGHFNTRPIGPAVQRTQFWKCPRRVVPLRWR